MAKPRRIAITSVISKIQNVEQDCTDMLETTLEMIDEGNKSQRQLEIQAGILREMLDRFEELLGLAEEY